MRAARLLPLSIAAGVVLAWWGLVLTAITVWAATA